jgi:conserved hypothetical protein
MKQLKTELKKVLSEPFDKELVDYAFRNLEDKSNPIRLNNFAYVLRELLYRILNRNAPHKEIVKCSWFIPMIKGQSSLATKIQQMQYLMLDHFPNDFVKKVLGIDAEREAGQLNEILKFMNVCTHINPKMIKCSDKDIERKVCAICTLFITLFNTVKKIRTKIHQGVSDSIDKELLEKMYMDTCDEVDILSTHSTIEDYSILDLKMKGIADKKLTYAIEGSVKVHLQYGSDYDNKNDNGYETDESFPFSGSFTCTLTGQGINNYKIESCNIDIDTNSFYE